jgi:hypothetical protein
MYVPSAWFHTSTKLSAHIKQNTHTITDIAVAVNKYMTWKRADKCLKYRHLLNKQTPWPLVRERIIPTERPPLVGEI